MSPIRLRKPRTVEDHSGRVSADDLVAPRRDPAPEPAPAPAPEPEPKADAPPEVDTPPEAEVEPEPAVSAAKAESKPGQTRNTRKKGGAKGGNARKKGGAKGGSAKSKGGSAKSKSGSAKSKGGSAKRDAKAKPEVKKKPPREGGAKVIAFANQKGGVAKTTTALNLAVAFKESGHNVLAIDMDPQGNLTMSQGVDPDKVEKSMFDVLVHRIPLRDVIVEREIDVAVASIDLAGAEIAMSAQIGRERSLQKAIAEIRDDYHFICIDTPPSLGLLTVNALTAADKVIVPVQCEYLSMRGLVQLQNTLQMIRENLNPDVEIEGILPTMLDSRTVHAKEAVEILEENFGDLVFQSRIRKAIKFAEAPVRGSSVLKYDPDGNAAKYYRELAEEVLTHGS